MWVRRPPLSSFCYLSHPARTTLMTSAVKTQRAYVSPPPPRPVLRQIPGGLSWWGGDLRSWVWGGGGGGIQMLFFPRELNNFKVHLGEPLQTYFSALGSLFVGACPLYVCLSRRERERLCYSSVRISPSAFMQPKDEWISGIVERKKKKKTTKQAVKRWMEMLLWASVRKVVKRFHGCLCFCPSGSIKWPWIASRPNGASLR